MCGGIEVASKSPTSVNLKWKNDDHGASDDEYEVESKGGPLTYVSSRSSINITGLSPATLYNFSITPKINGTQSNITVVTVATTTGKLSSSQG